MRVLIFGDRGWIGGMVCKYLEKENIDFVKASCRANDKKLVEEELLKVEPTHVMSFIGRTHGVIGEKEYTTIDYLEQKGKILENVRDNLFSPVVLSLLCKKHDIHFSYLGTGCIFEFDEEHPFGEEVNGFNEQSLPNFFGSSYSTVKGYTDELMHLFEESTLNLRIRMPITDEVNKRNFITKITTYEKVCSVPNSMTVLDELIPILVDMACNKVTGTVNLTNPGLISHNEMLEMYKEIVDPDFTWNNFSLEEQAEILAGGRSNNFLDTSKLESLYPEVRNIKDAVRETMKTMKEKIDCKCTSCDC